MPTMMLSSPASTRSSANATDSSFPYFAPTPRLTDVPPEAPPREVRLHKALREAAEYMGSQVDLPGEIQIGQRSQKSLAQQLESRNQAQHDKGDSLDVTVTKFDDRAPTTVEARSVDELFDMLDPEQYQFRSRVVCLSGLSSGAIGLLGSMLKIDPYFFAMHVNTGAVSVSSALVTERRVQTSHRFMKFRYRRLDVDKKVVEETISLYVADTKSGESTAIIMFNDYDLQSEISSSGERRASTLQTAILKYISDSAYSEGKRVSYSWRSLPLATISILVKEWSSLLSRETALLENINDLISEVPWTESRRARSKKTAEVRQLHSQIQSKPSFFKSAILDIDTTKDLLEECHTDTKGFNTLGYRESDLMEAELQQLSTQANAAMLENDEVNERAATLLFGSAGSFDFDNHRDKQMDSIKESHQEPISGGDKQMDNIKESHQEPISGGDKQMDSIKESHLEPISGGDRFQHHIQTKIDQIAYMTCGLLSMSFVASLYGMNLDIFTDGGTVSLAKFLYTALPFTFGVLTLTFGPQYLVKARRVASANFNLHLV